MAARQLTPEDQKVDRSAKPGWPTGAEALPAVGDDVYCTAGAATVFRLLGKTGDGSRLLELRLTGGGRESFFAASSNVLIAPKRTGRGDTGFSADDPATSSGL